MHGRSSSLRTTRSGSARRAFWEIAIKAGLGRGSFRIDVESFAAALATTGLTELPIRANHAVPVPNLPPLHRDPFDRIPVAQAISEPLVLVTNDRTLSRCDVPIRIL